MTVASVLAQAPAPSDLEPGVDVDALLFGLAIGAAAFLVIFGLGAALTVIRRFLDVQ